MGDRTPSGPISAQVPAPSTAVRDRAPVVRIHGFAALLGALVVAVVALAAGGTVSTAAVLGASMALLQLAIGVLGGVAAATPRLATRLGGRSPRAIQQAGPAVALGAGLAFGGVLLAGLAAPLSAVLALVVLAVGAWHELAARGTRLSWLPVAVGVPLLPLFGWLGAGGTLAGPFAVLGAGAVLGGTALAIAAEGVDVDRDRDAGLRTLAVWLGPVLVALVVLGLQLAVAGLAWASIAGLGASGGWVTAVGATALLAVAGACLGLVVARRGTAARELAFEVQAVGLGLLAVAWVNAMSAAAAV